MCVFVMMVMVSRSVGVRGQRALARAFGMQQRGYRAVTSESLHVCTHVRIGPCALCVCAHRVRAGASACMLVARDRVDQPAHTIARSCVNTSINAYLNMRACEPAHMRAGATACPR